MKLDLRDAAGLDLATLDDDALARLAGDVNEALAEDRKQNAIVYYRPASPRARAAHLSTARKLGIGGGNGASKTETAIAELVAFATGRLPRCDDDDELRVSFRAKFRGPVACRMVCESLTTTLHPVILPKLRWYHWTGLKPWGGTQGHWGWIPRDCLVDGDWSKSWSEKNRTLSLYCYDPDNPTRRLGVSTIQFMSKDQDAEDFASGDYDLVILDEPPRESIYVECEARTMRVAGRIILSMTWPDTPESPVDWIFDRLYDRAEEGGKIQWLELYTTENPHLDQQAVAAQMADWTDTERQVRIYGRPIRFSNLIHPDFTDQERYWCFDCGKLAVPFFEASHVRCGQCSGGDVTTFSHVQGFEVDESWPVVCLLDPHPRKPHMLLWVAVDPSDDWWVIAEAEIEEHDVDLAHTGIERVESEQRMRVQWRLMDPNMGRSLSNARTEEDWQTEFMNAGLNFALANDDGVGRSRVNEMLRVDRSRRQPRCHIHPRCVTTIKQMKRYSWDEHKRSLEKDQKQRARDKYDDFPTLLKYLANAQPTFRGLRDIGMVVVRTPNRRPHRARYNPTRRKVY